MDISVIYDAGVVGLRMLMPLFAIVIVYQCYAAMRRRRRPEKPLVSLYNPNSGGMIPVCGGDHWPPAEPRCPFMPISFRKAAVPISGVQCTPLHSSRLTLKKPQRSKRRGFTIKAI